jgi:hypothetical protein
LFTGGCEDDPDFSGANPTVYTNLWLQIKSKLLAGEAGSEPWRRIYFTAFSRPPLLTLETPLPHRGCGHRGAGPALFRKPTGRCRQHLLGARLISHSLRLVLVLVIVIVLEGENRIEQEHEHDYDGGGAPKCAACDS